MINNQILTYPVCKSVGSPRCLRNCDTRQIHIARWRDTRVTGRGCNSCIFRNCNCRSIFLRRKDNFSDSRNPCGRLRIGPAKEWEARFLHNIEKVLLFHFTQSVSRYYDPQYTIFFGQCGRTSITRIFS